MEGSIFLGLDRGRDLEGGGEAERGRCGVGFQGEVKGRGLVGVGVWKWDL